MAHPLGQNGSMHETPNRLESIFSAKSPTSGITFSVPCTDDEGECPLFLLCEHLAARFHRDCLLADTPRSVRRRLERRIRRRLRLDRERAAALFDLALELQHLKDLGCYQKPIAEIGRLIALVSGTELRPEDN